MSSEAPTFEDDYRFVFAKSGKARAPRPGSSKPGGGSAGTGGGPKLTTAAAMRSKLLSAVSKKPQVMVKITSYGKSAQAVKAHVDYISRKGELDVFDGTGENLSEFAERAGQERREALEGVAEDLAAAQEHAVRRRDGRVTMNLMLSMPPGTDTGAFELATREFLAQQFGNRDHLLAFHDDREHYHAHIVVGLKGDDGRWLNPRKADLKEWRENFAEALEKRGIAASATPAYSRGRGKDNVRKGVIEAERRGKRTRPQRARGPSYDAETEGAAIERRAAAWSRIADHYQHAGDAEAAGAISEYVADRFDYHHPAPTPTPAPADAARVADEFADLASKREAKLGGYRDNSDRWRFDTPRDLRKRVDDYISTPAEQRPAELARIAAEPSTGEMLKQRTREQARSR